MLSFAVDRPDLNAWILFLQSHDAVMKCAEATLQDVGLTPAQYTALLALKFLPDPVRPSDVARWAFRSANAITYLMDGLEKAGLVRRFRNPTDRRSIRLEMTAKGEAVYAQARQPAWELIEKLMSTYSEDELATFTHLLEELRGQALRRLSLDGKDMNSETDSL